MDYWQINNSADFFTGFWILKNDKVKKNNNNVARMNNTKLDKKSDALKKIKKVFLFIFKACVTYISVLTGWLFII